MEGSNNSVVVPTEDLRGRLSWCSAWVLLAGYGENVEGFLEGGKGGHWPMKVVWPQPWKARDNPEDLVSSLLDCWVDQR
jgi:hypothetical protein